MAEKLSYSTNDNLLIGIADADLLDNGTRHPNLTLLKLAGYFKDHNIAFELIEDSDADINRYSKIYLAKVFSFTKDPHFYTDCPPRQRKKLFCVGGTGWYMGDNEKEDWKQRRDEDLQLLELQPDLPGLCMRTQMPYYHLYDHYVEQQLARGIKKEHYKDYLYYSIGFLTRGCFRHCPFCVNRLENKSAPYSSLDDFWDKNRPYIYLWDDNFLASPHWEQLLDKLIATGRPFQFRQGLDERLLAQNKRGEEMAKKLAIANYHGDFIFAFDNWFDRKLVEKALKIWKYYCPKKETKFYLFCGFRQTPSDDKKFQLDIAEIFMRICVLMRYGCLGYIMRHEDYKKSPLPNLYVQIARWCNQPGFYRNLSFWQFCYKNQTYWEEQTLGIKHNKLKTYKEFIADYENGYYDKIGMCTPLKTIFDFLNKHKEHEALFLSFFNLSFKDMIDPKLWYRDTEIIYNGVKYTMNAEFWEHLSGNQTNELVLLKAFYTHADKTLLDEPEKSVVLLEILQKYKCSEILSIIRDGFKPYEVSKKDPSQFSDFRDAYYQVPYLLANCGMPEVDYNQMGYMLRSEKRNQVADKKYGENHIKTAAQLGLCNFAKCRASTNALGNSFIKLSETAQKNILPKLCLYIPYIQNYFMEGATDAAREEILSVLSKTTQNRRRPNVNLIIGTIKDAVEYEL